MKLLLLAVSLLLMASCKKEETYDLFARTEWANYADPITKLVFSDRNKTCTLTTYRGKPEVNIQSYSVVSDVTVILDDSNIICNKSIDGQTIFLRDRDTKKSLHILRKQKYYPQVLTE